MKSKFINCRTALLLCVTLFFAFAGTAEAKTKKVKYGTIRILSTPGKLPVVIDGKAYGETLTEYRSIDLDPGVHTVVITLPNGQLWTREIDLPAGRVKCIALNYRPVPRPTIAVCPFPVNISAPREVNEGEIVTYASDVSYGGKSDLKYTWSVSPSNARVINGSGTPNISIDSTGLGGQQITATLLVADNSGNPLCRQVAQVSTNVPRHEKRANVGREFDTCKNCSNDDLKARLDIVAIELQGDPSTTTYLFSYGGRTSPAGEAERQLKRARDYLVTKRGIDASRIVLANGGFREQNDLEMWIVPRGATGPQPTPTLQPGDVKSVVVAPKTKRVN